MNPTVLLLVPGFLVGVVILRGLFWFADRAGRRAERFVGGRKK